MKELFQELLNGLKATDLATRVVIGMSVVLLAGVMAVVGMWASKPHMVPLHTGLDDTQFSAATRALATSGIRFEASSPPGPYSIFVDEDERYAAQNAISTQGALDLGPRGIPTDTGSSSIFLGKDERDQINLKRNWQELEHQLRALSFVVNAVVRISPGTRSPLMRRSDPTVSVLVHIRNGNALERNQRNTLAAIVRHATNVPDENITISDQHGNSLFDGSRDEGLDAALDFERGFTIAETRRAQEYLDRVFGPGMAAVSVSGEWNHDRREQVDSTYDPTKFKVNEVTSETRTPIEAAAGGPAGIASNIQAAAATTSPTEPPVAETLDTENRYTYGSKTTHTVQVTPTLQRLSVTLTLDSSLEDRLAEAKALVEDLVGFQETRDEITATALPLAGIERDADGNPIPLTVEPMPEAPNETTSMLIERGVEIAAALAFMFILLRSLRRARAGKGSEATTSTSPDGLPSSEEDIDIEALARRQIEQLVQDDPERVGTLLSRWALGEIPYSSTPR